MTAIAERAIERIAEKRARLTGETDGHLTLIELYAGLARRVLCSGDAEEAASYILKMSQALLSCCENVHQLDRTHPKPSS